MDNPTRQAIRAWLEQPEQIAAMQEASDRGRPALEAVDAAFLERFGEQENSDKAQIGKLVRAVMEANGYEMLPESVAEVPCRETRVFLNASRYQRVTA